MRKKDIKGPSLIPGKYTTVIILAALVGLILLSSYSYPLFHSLAELFSVIVAFGIFVITWNSRTLHDNSYLIFIGIASLFIGSIDILHALSYKGMGVFPGMTTNLSTQLWILMRYVTALSFLVAPLFLGRRLRVDLTFLTYAAVITLSLLSVFYWQVFPVCYVEGIGLTPFKVWSEYIISTLFAGAVVVLFRRRALFDKGVWQFLVSAYLFSIGSELAFTLYTDVYGITNLTGHLLEIISFYLIYRAIIETGLTRPYDLLFRSLKQREEALQSALASSEQRQNEVSALLAGSRAILKYGEFRDIARSIFDACKNLIGAKAGYIALLSADGTQNEVVFLESGGMPCSVDPFQSMPIRGLRAEAYRTGKAVYHNDFANSEWVKYMPAGHVALKNVIFAPLVIEDKTVGLLGMANKPDGFNDNDARMSAAFAELAAIALRNSRMWSSLEKSERRFRAVAETATDAIVTVDSLGKVVLWNRGAEKMFGYPAGEILGKPLFSIVPAKLRETHQAGMTRFFTGGEPKILGRTVEQVGLRKDGSEFPMELSLASWRAGEATFVTAIMRDITERKRGEEQLRAYERLATLGQVAGSISHEIRNPLAIIGTSVFYLESRLKDADEKTREHLKRIHASVQRSTGIIQSLLNLTRMKEPYFEKFDLRGTVAESLVNAALPGTVKVISEQPAEAVAVKGDREQLDLAFGNIITNASQAMEGKGTLSVLLRKENGQAHLSFADTGHGITTENMRRLFQPFFSTKARGIGFGLPIAKMVVEKHGGRIDVQSTPGAGATFTVILPLNQEVKENNL